MPASSLRDKGSSTEKVVSPWLKAFRPRQKWSNNKDEFLDALYWLRQVLCLVLGLTWGIIPLQGYVGITLFLAVNGAFVYGYCMLYQRVDEEEYGGIWELLKEGFMTSFALFLVTWIITYTALHHS